MVGIRPIYGINPQFSMVGIPAIKMVMQMTLLYQHYTFNLPLRTMRKPHLGLKKLLNFQLFPEKSI